jgi:hypothetical protein
MQRDLAAILVGSRDLVDNESNHPLLWIECLSNRLYRSDGVLEFAILLMTSVFISITIPEFCWPVLAGGLPRSRAGGRSWEPLGFPVRQCTDHKRLDCRQGSQTPNSIFWCLLLPVWAGPLGTGVCEPLVEGHKHASPFH